MKKLFYTALTALTLFEIANVYFIMPMPGSQRMESIGIAYFLYSWRWWFRIGLGLLALFAFFKSSFSKWQWVPVVLLAGFWAVVTYMFNFEMTADKMFVQPKLNLKHAAGNQVDTARIVLGVALGDSAAAYPIQYMAYHHQVRDTVDGIPVMVTYCNVCRSGRVFQPELNDQPETFRLVGMDHFNAMFEDATTKSWWRQENGEAVAGPLRGNFLEEFTCYQMSLGQWLGLHPYSRIMQPDTVFKEEYDAQKEFETGKKKGNLTGTDSLSWGEKSWVVGIEIKGVSKAFDWNELKQRRILNDSVGNTPIVLALAADNKSFNAFVRPAGAVFLIQNDTLLHGAIRYDFAGRTRMLNMPNLKAVSAYQEFWHSWRTFHGNNK